MLGLYQMSSYDAYKVSRTRFFLDSCPALFTLFGASVCLQPSSGKKLLQCTQRSLVELQIFIPIKMVDAIGKRFLMPGAFTVLVGILCP